MTSPKSHPGGQADDVRSLKKLSIIAEPSIGERRRLDRAGNDPAQVRQVLVDLHEVRLKDWQGLLKDIEGRKRGLEASRLPGIDQSALLADQTAAASRAQVQVDEYEAALARFRAWRASPSQEAAVAESASTSTPLQPSVKPTLSVPQRPPMVAGVARRNAGKPKLANPAPSGAVPVAPHTPGSQPALSSSAVQPPAVSLGKPVSASASETEVLRSLDLWSSAMSANDASAAADAYAPSLTRYFLARDASNAFVKRDKQSFFDRGNRITQFSLRDPVIAMISAEDASVSVVKDVAVENRTTSTHRQIRSKLQLHHFTSGWKITGERDLR